MSRQVRDSKAPPDRSTPWPLPRGKTIAAGSADGTVTTWDAGRPEELRLTFKASPKAIAAMAFGARRQDDRRRGLDRAVRLIDPANGRERSWSEPRRRSRPWPFSPDGKLLASASDGERPFRLGDAGGHRSRPGRSRGLRATKGSASLAFSPDGKTLRRGRSGRFDLDMTPATGRRRRSPAGPGKERVTLRGQPTTSEPDLLEGGRRMATRSEDGVVKVWDLSDNRRR